VDLLTKLIEKIAYPRTQEFLEGVEIRYQKEVALPNGRIEVPTFVEIEEEEADIEVHYRFHKKQDHWRLYDVLIDEVSLVENYRFQFDEIITEDSYPELVSLMTKKLNE